MTWWMIGNHSLRAWEASGNNHHLAALKILQYGARGAASHDGPHLGVDDGHGVKAIVRHHTGES